MLVYDKNNPFLASIKERYPLTKNGSKKNTLHLVLDLAQSLLSYKVGDSVGIYPQNTLYTVNKILHALKLKGDERVTTKFHPKEITLKELLISKANSTTVSPRLFQAILQKQTDLFKKNFLQTLVAEEQRDEYKNYIDSFEIWDFLMEHEAVQLSAQEFATTLMPLLPRFYSISSSQKVVGNEIHLTIAPVIYETRGHKRHGVCTHFLSTMVELNQPVVPIFIQTSHSFGLPEDPHAHALIMIGPGTGIAPFRAFLQERLHHHQSSAKHWLFFGEWNQHTDFFYEEEWKEFQKLGFLHVDIAFSRDQEQKIYVQNRMWEKGADLYQWLEDGALLYVCGDAKRMAKDVELELLRIIQVFGEKEEGEAKLYLKELRKNKRYLRDVY